MPNWNKYEKRLSAHNTQNEVIHLRVQGHSEQTTLKSGSNKPVILRSKQFYDTNKVTVSGLDMNKLEMKDQEDLQYGEPEPEGYNTVRYHNVRNQNDLSDYLAYRGIKSLKVRELERIKE